MKHKNLKLMALGLLSGTIALSTIFIAQKKLNYKHNYYALLNEIKQQLIKNNLIIKTTWTNYPNIKDFIANGLCNGGIICYQKNCNDPIIYKFTINLIENKIINVVH